MSLVVLVVKKLWKYLGFAMNHVRAQGHRVTYEITGSRSKLTPAIQSVILGPGSLGLARPNSLFIFALEIRQSSRKITKVSSFSDVKITSLAAQTSNGLRQLNLTDLTWDVSAIIDVIRARSSRFTAIRFWLLAKNIFLRKLVYQTFDYCWLFYDVKRDCIILITYLTSNHRWKLLGYAEYLFVLRAKI